MSEHLGYDKPEKSEAEIAAQITRISSQLGKRALHVMDGGSPYYSSRKEGARISGGIRLTESGDGYSLTKEVNGQSVVAKRLDAVGEKIQTAKIDVEGGRVNGSLEQVTNAATIENPQNNEILNVPLTTRESAAIAADVAWNSKNEIDRTKIANKERYEARRQQEAQRSELVSGFTKM